MQRILLALGLLITSSFSQFHDIESSVNNIFIKNSDLLFSNSELYSTSFQESISQTKRKFKLNVVLNDIYREWTANKSLMYAGQYGYDLNLRLPIKWFKTDGIFTTQVSTRYLNFRDNNDTHDAQYSISDFSTYLIDNSILLNQDNHQVGLSFKAVLGSGRTHVNIDRFPKDDDDDLLNQYFYDLIEPTIGRKIDFTPRFRQFSLLVEHRYKINNFAQYDIRLGLGKAWDAYDFSYFTSTEKIKGLKNFTGPLHSNQINIGVGIHLSHKLFDLHPAFFFNKSQYDISLKADNPVKSGDILLEFLKLGNSKLSQSGVGGGIGISRRMAKSVLIEGGFALLKKDIEGDGSFTTPVLGFEILPIAHQFEGSYRGEMPVLLIQGQFQHKLNKFIDYNLVGEYINSKLDFRYNALAEMEFGIRDSQQAGVNTYFIDIYRLSLDALIRIDNNWKVSPKIVQIIPDIREKKKKKPSVEPPTVKRKKKYSWGGTFYMLGFHYNF